MTSITLKPIHKQVVAVIGASSGIGRATALQFAQQGAKVVISARSQSGLASLADEISQFGGEVLVVPADVSSFEQVRAIADKTVNHFGRLDTWVHLAATAVIAPFEQTTPEEFKRVIEVNLMGQVYGAMAALPHLRREGRGALIHVTSVEAHRSLPLQSSYSASKHGVEGFVDSLRVELKHEGVPISVTNVMPATINTPFYNKVQTKLGVKPTGIPPYYDPKLVAEAILHVAEHPQRDIIVGDAGKVLDILQKVVPSFVDAVLQAVAVEGQRTQVPEAADAPNNLYEPIEDSVEYVDRIEGDFGNLTIPSFFEGFRWHPLVKWGTLAGVAALTLLATQTLFNQQVD